MNDSSIEREIVIWVAGLISTDGNARNHGKGTKSIGYTICSVEEDWLNLIKNKLMLIDIPSKILTQKRSEKGRLEKSFYPREYFVSQLYINNPAKLTLLFDTYNCKEWFNPRKWRMIEQSIDFYKHLNTAGNKLPYTEGEKMLIIKNNEETIRNIRDIINLGKPKWLSRSYDSVRAEYEKLRISGQIKRFCPVCKEPIPKERMSRGKYCSLSCCYKMRNSKLKDYKLEWQKRKRRKLKLTNEQARQN